jgi:hypothetical protein
MQNPKVSRMILAAAVKRNRPIGVGYLASVLAHATLGIPDDLSEQEFLVVVEACSGWAVAAHDLGDMFIGTEKVWDAGGFLDAPEIYEGREVDGWALARKLGNWTPLQRLALLNAVDAWWEEVEAKQKTKREAGQ